MDVTAAQRLEELRALITNARAMPMSASCVINRGDVLAAIDALEVDLPAEIDQAKGVLAESRGKVDEGKAEATRIIEAARSEARDLAGRSEVVRVAEEQADKIRADAEHEAEALRTETDAFIDSRMASFESVLVKTVSQLKTARHRLAERSGLDDEPAKQRTELPDLT